MTLNFRILVLIVLVGIFTVSSFIFDQMVIYSEDKIREKISYIKDLLVITYQVKL